MIQRLYDFSAPADGAEANDTAECPRDGDTRPEARRGESSHASDYQSG